MVRTRGLGRALGRVIGRALGSEDCHDSDDAPQRRRPTASARRQPGAVRVAEDDPVVVADEPMVAADAGADIHPPGANAGANAGADEPEGFSGGSNDPSVLIEYAKHVAAGVWTEEERPELNLSSHGRKVQKLGRHVPAIEGLVVGTGLSPLIARSVDTGDRGLISSFMERWHRETHSVMEETTQMRTSYAVADEPTTATMNTGTFTFTEANRSQENEENTVKHCAKMAGAV
ncbi:uncharacterized protein LOC114410509 [Glycine soja]|uniref:uncharacterized protein LOC114410509 n=1 Tax=Glycine soja TaxID=3848 RepID=UPI00103BFC05|nr:uncharacterized protein LOC114410509 [Glycine soja]